MSTDLHGNGGDFAALRRRFEQMAQGPGSAYWVQLGDLVHAPSERAALYDPALYDPRDDSMAIVDGFLDLERSHPGHVHVVLGNHDHAHIGGPRTRKFHDDEAAWLEAALDDGAPARLRGLFTRALLAVAAPCGVLLAHGSPAAEFDALEDLDAIDPTDAQPSPRSRVILRSLLTSYGQPGEVTAALLARISRPGLALHLVVHGHDRDESGWFVEGGNQVCPVIFGAPRHEKRCLVLDLAARYVTPEDLRDGVEIVRVHGAEEP
ncbi:MAG: metallophosphoesterase [Deltaproteobacteria bacterium]